jgi:hypothetical protein
LPCLKAIGIKHAQVGVVIGVRVRAGLSLIKALLKG